MGSRQVVVIGASAGGIEALRLVAGGLPPDFAAAICVVMHMAPESPGVLPGILSRSGPLPALSPANGERLRPGRIYVAPPDQHLLVEPGLVRLSKGPRENRFRPAVDPLFRSAAQVYGPAAIGVVLTGSLDDGTAGLWTIKQMGGTAVVQDPAEALFPAMPRSALEHVQVDHVVPLEQIAPLLVRLTTNGGGAPGPVEPPPAVAIEVKIAMDQNPVDAGIESLGRPSNYACPDCHGVLLQVNEGSRTRFRCHTGHAYSVQSLLAAVNDGIEDALWNAIRALEEGWLLMQRMAEHLKTGHTGAPGDRIASHGDDARRLSNVLRELAAGWQPPTE